MRTLFLQMPRNVTYLERFEYVCRECNSKGSVVDVLLNPDVLLIRGFCPRCNKRGTYKVVDIDALRREHLEIAKEDSNSNKLRWKLTPLPNTSTE